MAHGPVAAAVVLAVLLPLLGAGCAPSAPAPASTPVAIPAPAPASSAPAPTRDTVAAMTALAALTALAVLRRWDVRRAAAWAAGDARALRALYVRGSSAGSEDARMLQEYAARGLAVRGMQTQVLAGELLESRSGRLRVRVLDRVVGADVAEPGSRTVALPPGRPRVRLVVLERVAGRWLVRSVRPGCQRSAAASRSQTSLCAKA